MLEADRCPALAELIAYCSAHGIKGSYSARHDPPWWRARIKVGMEIHSGAADTRDAALERIAEIALRDLLDPMPQPGTREYVEWQRRRNG